LRIKLLEYLDKLKNSGFIIVPIILDGLLTNCKIVKQLLNQTNNTNTTKKLPVGKIKLEPYFTHNDEKYFPLFCTPHIVKYVRNNFIKKDNYFEYPTLYLSTGYVLQASICTFKWIKELHEINKNKLINSVQLNNKIVLPCNLDEQSVDAALAIFLPEAISALRFEFREKTKETYLFLEIVNDYMLQLLLTTNIRK